MSRSWVSTRDPWPLTSRKCRGSMNKLNQIFPNKRHNSHKPAAAAGSAFTIYLWVSNIYLKSTHDGIHYTLWEEGNKLKLILSIYSDGSSLLPSCHYIIGDSTVQICTIPCITEHIQDATNRSNSPLSPLSSWLGHVAGVSVTPGTWPGQLGNPPSLRPEFLLVLVCTRGQ